MEEDEYLCDNTSTFLIYCIKLLYKLIESFYV